MQSLSAWQRLLQAFCLLAPLVHSSILPVNECFLEPPFSLAFPVQATPTTFQLVLRDDALTGNDGCPLTTMAQLADVTVVTGVRNRPDVHVKTSTVGLTLTVTSPARASNNVLQLSLSTGTTPLFAAPVVFYEAFHLDSARLENNDGVLSLIGQGRGFPSLPKLPGLRLRVRSSIMSNDMQQWQLVCTAANTTTVSRPFLLSRPTCWAPILIAADSS
jgi:hypothetical protein